MTAPQYGLQDTSDLSYTLINEQRQEITCICICEVKGANQLHSNRAADQRLWFRCIDRVIPLLPKSKTSSLWLSPVAEQSGLCRTWSEIPKTGFVVLRFILNKMACAPSEFSDESRPPAILSRVYVMRLKKTMDLSHT